MSNSFSSASIRCWRAFLEKNDFQRDHLFGTHSGYSPFHCAIAEKLKGKFIRAGIEGEIHHHILVVERPGYSEIGHN
jgi:hypothetical protein